MNIMHYLNNQLNTKAYNWLFIVFFILGIITAILGQIILTLIAALISYMAASAGDTTVP